MAERTYAVVAIENVNEEPMPDVSEDAFGELKFFASPLIGDYNPVTYNIVSMSGNYTDMTEDGTLYRLLECDNIEIFADYHAGIWNIINADTNYDVCIYCSEEDRREIYG